MLSLIFVRMISPRGGGQGAPCAPLYHDALATATGLSRPLAVLNLGGVGNVTWLGDDGHIMAFDTGPANALLDDWCNRHTGRPFDADGELAAHGQADMMMVAAWLEAPFFATPPPKSLDRNCFDIGRAESLSPADGAATLTAFTVVSASKATEWLPGIPMRWLVTGGGRRNPVMMASLSDKLGAIVEPVESVGWDGDSLEAQAFAYLAVRSLKSLPLSLPATTGVPEPLTGGRLVRIA